MLKTDVPTTRTSATVTRRRSVNTGRTALVTAPVYPTFATSGTGFSRAIFDASWSAIEAKPMATENLLLHPDRWPLYSTS